MSGNNREVNMRSKREVLGLIRTLEAQGARVEWGGGNRGSDSAAGHFPARVYPPDPERHFILFHGSVSDGNAATIKRNEVRRAGLRWPGDDGISAKHLRKAGAPGMTTNRTETPMSDSRTIIDRKPGEHLVTPPGVLTQPKPSRRTVETFRPVLDLLPEVFWTDAAANAIRILGIGGYAKGTDGNRIQLMLDWFGYRVIQTKPNRNGLSYQWAREGQERQDVSQRGGTALRAVEPLTAEPAVPAGFEVFQPSTESEETPAVLPADAGPIAAAFAEAERKRADKSKHERVMCIACKQWFTSQGLERHFEDTGHDKPAEKPKVVIDPQAEGGFPLYASPEDAKAETNAVYPEEVTTLSEAIETLRGGPVDLEQALQQEDARDDVAEWRALIEEAEAETARVREELASTLRDLQAAREVAADAAADRDSAREFANRQADLLNRRRIELDEARAQAVRWEKLADQTELVVDDTWLIPVEENADTKVGTLVARAAKLGMVVTLQGRRA